ncbi:MAG: hypothetical protein H6766_01220 [Candidatus Peribacteria bacterium]|nr:MAG: hypothetical protein H6766_01220 [Candidatus Peribacteria bacterium]
MASALEVGDIFNAVQVIKNMVVTRDGMPGTSSNTILNINQPGADRANQIYVMK